MTAKAARHLLATALAAIVLLAGDLAVSGNAQANESDRPVPGDVCTQAARAAEHRYGIPSGLLQEVAWVETAYQGRPWPWSLNVQGKPFRLPTRNEAIGALRKLLAAGIRNVDAGCLQLNFQWAAKGMTPVQAMDPAANADTAARWLVNLKQKHGSWGQAVTRYHSARPSRGRAYECRLARRLAQRWLGRRLSHPGC